MSSMRIELVASGARAGARDLDRMAAAANRLAAAQERLNRSGGSAGGGAAGNFRQAAASAVGGGAGGAVARTRTATGGPRISGPYAALERARLNLASARTATERADAEHAYNQAQARIDRMNRPPASLVSRLGSVAATSRYNLGGMSPLLGRTLGALGVGGDAVGGFSLVAAGAGAAGLALHRLASAALEGGQALREVRDTSTISGGSLRESAFLRALGGSAAEAASLRERLATDPMAMTAGASIGVRAIQSPFGSPNNARLWLKTIEGLRETTNQEQRLTRARMLGVESMLPLTRMSDQSWQSLRRTAEALGDLEDSMGNSGADFDASAKRWEMALERVNGSLFKAVAPGATDALNKAADLLEGGAKWDPLAQGKKNWSALVDLITNPSWDKLQRGFTGGGTPSRTTGANNAQVRATEQNTRAIERQTQLLQGHTFGGGSRASGAIPPMYSGQAAQNNMQYGNPRWPV